MMSLKEKSPNIIRSVSTPINISKEIGKRTGKPQVAVFITHGMGQQVPFETLDAVVEGLANAAERKGNAVKVIRARTVQIGDVKTQRAEFDMRDAQNREVEVHVYEGYWAPITEGQVTLRDVMTFLFHAGLNGLSNCRSFERWIFGRSVSFGRQLRAEFRLLTIFGVLLSLVVLNAVIATVSGFKFFSANSLPVYSEPVFSALTSVVGTYVIACMVFVIPLGALLFLKSQKRKAFLRNIWGLVTWLVLILFQAWILLTIVSGLVLILLVIKCLNPNPLICSSISEHWYLIWGSLLLVSWYVRKVFVQYLGDVAAYVDSHSLDRFNDIRTRIKARVFEQAKAVYSIQQYEHIAMVGHSLGSVITYDTLNALINQDDLNGKSLKAAERTKLLLTFGSPLDKIAFLFASQINNATATREALAATLQPMIQKYIPFRNIKWINVYSPRDIVSGKLEYYDDSVNADYSDKRAIENIIDTDATIPLAAHIEYWDNTTLFDELYANL